MCWREMLERGRLDRFAWSKTGRPKDAHRAVAMDSHRQLDRSIKISEVGNMKVIEGGFCVLARNGREGET